MVARGEKPIAIDILAGSARANGEPQTGHRSPDRIAFRAV
jgi:hypothetical protein